MVESNQLHLLKLSTHLMYYLILLLHYILEANVVLYTPLQLLFYRLIYFIHSYIHTQYLGKTFEMWLVGIDKQSNIIFR